MAQLRWTTTDASPDTLFDDVVDRHVGRGEYRGLEFFHVEAKRLINHVPSPLPFDYTINVYRGCSHACSYCFARPTHDYLGFNIAEDFDSKIVVKVNAVELARTETAPGRWAGHRIAMGTNTDPYQRAEGRYRLTRGVVGVLAERRNPFSVLTKSSLVLRDLDVLAEAAAHADVVVDFSIPTLDEDVWKATEPGTPHPRRRIEAVRRLNEAGIPSGVLVAPIIPGMSDAPDQLREVAAACIDAGARFASPMYLHLRGPMRGHWFDWLRRHRPELVDRYQRSYGRRAYAPDATQKRLTEQFRAELARLGGLPEPWRLPPKDSPPEPNTGDQLQLGL